MSSTDDEAPNVVEKEQVVEEQQQEVQEQEQEIDEYGEQEEAFPFNFDIEPAP